MTTADQEYEAARRRVRENFKEFVLMGLKKVEPGPRRPETTKTYMTSDFKVVKREKKK